MAYHHTKFVSCPRCGKTTVEGVGKCYHCGGPIGGQPPVVEQEIKYASYEPREYAKPEPAYEPINYVKPEPVYTPPEQPKSEYRAPVFPEQAPKQEPAAPERPVYTPFDAPVKKTRKKGGLKKIVLGGAAAFVAVIGIGVFGGEDESDPVDPDSPAVNSPAEEDTAPAAPSPAVIEETVVLDWEGVKVTAKSLDDDGIFGPELKLLIENNSAENYIVQSSYGIVNNYMVLDLLSEDVAAGKKSNTELTLLESYLKEAGIKNLTEISFDLNVLDPDTYMPVHSSGMVTLKTNYYGTYAQEYDDSGDVIFDNGSIRVISKGLGEDTVFGPELTLYAENNSDEPVIIQTSDFSVNGFMVTDLFSATMMPGTHYIGGVTLFESDLDENEISDVENVEFVINICDNKTFMTIESSDPITLNF